MFRKIQPFLKDDIGATAIEYCFIAGSIAIVIVGALSTIGSKLSGFFTQIAAVN